MKPEPPTRRQVADELGPAAVVWDGLLAALAERHGKLAEVWEPSKRSFGSMCRIQHAGRTLVHLTPEKGTIHAALVLGKRAAAAALASKLPERVKTLVREARPYAEGRGVRLEVASPADAAVVVDLVTLKTEAGERAR